VYYLVRTDMCTLYSVLLVRATHARQTTLAPEIRIQFNGLILN